ncbi:MAG: hypothetical protein IPL46_01545 [Saprospiraceae bacterium]|nr:hypothetical protein [Saprospiraceae bacterium]
MKVYFFIVAILTPLLLSGQIIDSRAIDVSLTIPQVAMMDLLPNTSTIELNVSAPTRAGEPIDMSNATDNSKWINHSSSLAPGGARRNVTAQILSGSLPQGMKLKVKAGNYRGNGRGDQGMPSQEIVLNNMPQVILRDIGACFTGRGVQQGHQLSFTLGYDNYSNIDFGNEIIVIAFTLTDN